MNKIILKIVLPIICGLTVANMYYIQSIFPHVIHTMNIDYKMASMIYTMSLIGNACSLIFITPLGDFFNRKKLISYLYILLSLACAVAFYSTNIYSMYIAAFCLGVGVAIIPITISYLSSKAEFGLDYIGKIMSGVLLGALISRFLSSEFSIVWGWHSIYLFSLIMMVVSLIIIFLLLPDDTDFKNRDLNYLKIISSTFSLVASNKTVFKYSMYGFSIMAVFAAFWNNISIYLNDNLNLEQINIGLFSLTGIAGASSAMFASKILKKLSYSNKVMFLMMLISFGVLIFISDNILILGVGSIIIDAMIQLIHVNNQTNMYGNCHGNESRAASCYMTTFIIGGIVGSKVASLIYVINGWQAVCVMCFCIAFICLVFSKPKKVIENSFIK